MGSGSLGSASSDQQANEPSPVASGLCSLWCCSPHAFGRGYETEHFWQHSTVSASTAQTAKARKVAAQKWVCFPKPSSITQSFWVTLDISLQRNKMHTKLSCGMAGNVDHKIISCVYQTGTKGLGSLRAVFIPYSEWEQCAAVTDFGERCANISYEMPFNSKDQLDCNMAVEWFRGGWIHWETNCPSQPALSSLSFLSGVNVSCLVGTIFHSCTQVTCFSHYSGKYKYFQSHERFLVHEWRVLGFYFYCRLNPAEALAWPRCCSCLWPVGWLQMVMG